ncbi:hypothetical protein [Sphingomonas hengshuiensis]|uniref:SCP2 domain-containing protein n=1 Tax=Sphingomonas hengshuiensis TaxID=1609977 RepID=A0A7U4J6U5_9SPHN|nr:hypothetical protein [Sphingomonas hengshuiensis]AJP71197.1 hypothetical protein TS85_04275 [Sphingomonas hengshuiensis]
MAGSCAAQTLAQAFDILERDEPAAFAAMALQLAGLIVSCTVDGERFFVSGAGRPQVSGAAGAAVTVWVESNRRAIIRLIDGDIDVLGAVRARQLRLTADIALMVRISRAQRAFAEGAARARRIRPLLEALRDAS